MKSLVVLMAGMLPLGIAGCSSTPGAQAPSKQPTSASAPIPEGQTIAGCAAAREDQSESVTGDDLVFGPLSYPGLAHGYPTDDGEPKEPGPDGEAFYKIGARLTAGAEVTVSIGSAARSYAGIIVENGRDGGYSRVTYRSCAGLPSGTVNWWVGGFVLHGRRAACVPLDLTSPGEEAKHIDLALPIGACN